MYFDENGNIVKFVPKHDLENIINAKIKQLNLCPPILSIDIIRNTSDLDLELIEFETYKIGGILVKKTGTSSIAINSLHSRHSQNFIGMHELIHYWFHPCDTHLCKEFYKNSEGYEFQANYMAAAALMPKDLFIEKYYQYSGFTDKLSNEFYVSPKAVEIRISNLKQDIDNAFSKYIKQLTKEDNLKEIFRIANKAIF
ncbi:MAG: ImmA/IrrE family metallo-endopeptidase [Clostridia bacterium]|nr:ImmA/IrrE family metallo-endopeptidase [Clostridia bacterium]